MGPHWAEAPFALIKDTGVSALPHIPPHHPAVEMAKSMSLTHNVILRSINASYNQCLAVQPGTTAARDFLYFNQALVEVLGIHHDVEEEYLFPAIEHLTGDEDIMESNFREHEEFEAGLVRFKEYIYSTSSEKYDGQKMQDLLNGFGSAVEKHLHNEIPTLLELYKYDGAALAHMSDELRKRTTARSSKIKHLPLFVGCADRTFSLDGRVESFPKIPMFVLYIAHFVFEPFHSGAWQFNPSDTFGQPRSGRYKEGPGFVKGPEMLYP